MNPGLTEEAGKVAMSVVDALRTQPMLLAILIFNVFLMVLVYWGTSDQRKHFVDLIKYEQDKSGKVLELMSECIARK